MDFPNSPTRNRPAHLAAVEQGDRSIIHFVTVCTEGRTKILANDSMHTLLRHAWAAARDYEVGRYVLMPDHVHLFCRPAAILQTTTLKRWVEFWKSWSARRWSFAGIRLWQRQFWDRQMRRGESYSAKWEYVRNNPVRAGLVKEPDHWPHRGEGQIFSWHDH